MNNPHPQPQPGSYRAPLIEGLRTLGRNKEANLFEDGTVKLGHVASFTGKVRTDAMLGAICAMALKSQPQTDITRYYIFQLENNLAVPAFTEGAYVYQENDPVAVAYVQATLKAEGEREYGPGELFLRS